jgi:putative membrane protein
MDPPRAERGSVARIYSGPRRDLGTDPDYRFTLANERTFLAWIRTALALDAGGLAVIQLLPELAVPWGREAIGLALVLLGTILAVTAFRRWVRNEEALRTDAPLPESRLPLLLAATVSVVSIVAVALLITTLA